MTERNEKLFSFEWPFDDGVKNSTGGFCFALVLKSRVDFHESAILRKRAAPFRRVWPFYFSRGRGEEGYGLASADLRS